MYRFRLLWTVLALVALGISLVTHAQDNDVWENLQVISVENVVNLSRLNSFTFSQGSVLDISFDTEGTSLLIINSNGAVQEWDFVAETSANTLNYESAAYATFNSDATEFACLCGDTSLIDDVQVFDIQTGENLLLIEDVGPVSDLSFGPSSQQLIVAGGWTRNDTRIQVWDIEHGQVVTTFPGGGWTSKADFDPSGDIIALGYSNTIEVWNLDTVTQMFALQQYYPLSNQGGLLLRIDDLTFDSNGTQIASMSPEGFIWLWSVETGRELRFFSDESITRDTTETLYSQNEDRIRFNPGNDLLVTVNGETVKLWSVADGALLKTLNQNASNVVFNEDGTIMATANEAGQVILWGVLPTVSQIPLPERGVPERS